MECTKGFVQTKQKLMAVIEQNNNSFSIHRFLTVLLGLGALQNFLAQ